MEEKFIAVWAANREKAESLGVRMRPIPAGEAMKTAHRALSGSRQRRIQRPSGKAPS